jgi:3-deoxy-D-manno-octulosonate 8-phosphate phosphatase KdsC-like HAD superfamily phosphatase
VAAGAIASAAIPGAAITGAAIGGAVGGLEKVMTDHGVSREDAGYYGDRINDGGVFVSVDTSTAGISPNVAEDVLYRLGGHSASRSKMASI